MKPTNDLSHIDTHSQAEEIANSVIHGIGAGLSAAGLAILVTLSVKMGDPWRIVSFSIYGSTLVLLYTMSTLYHGLTNPRAKQLFGIFDHLAIYLLIAGTYTPFMLVSLRGGWGWSMFGIIWGLATLGILQATLFPRLKLLGLIVYLAMGWLIVVPGKPLVAAVPIGGLVWLAVGGLFYTIGVVFYVNKRIHFNHAIWHLFVLGGSVSHFFAMFYFILPV